MKQNPIVLITLLLGLILFGCNKYEQETLTPQITNEKVETTFTTAIVTWTVDWPGKLISMLEVSENEDMRESLFYGSDEETENHSFKVTLTDLDAEKKYYYRFLVWNRYWVDKKFVMERKCFETMTGFLKGMFTINAKGNQVYFSQGNLQYLGSTNTWMFADNQWEVLDWYSQNNDLQGTSRDRFRWGTSGYSHGAVCYQPWSTGANNEYYFAYGQSNYNLYDQNRQADWGYNPIINGSNQENSCWRTPSHEEWDYVFHERSTLSGFRFAKAQLIGSTVGDINGMILLPDNWETSYFNLNEVNNRDSDFSSNVISVSQWRSLESKGAVFLPTKGYGMYWSSSSSLSGLGAYSLHFGYDLITSYVDDRSRSIYVRLVCDAQ